MPDATARVLVRPCSTSCATVCLPSPVTWAGTRSAIATIVPADHQHAVVVAGHVGLHHDLTAARLLHRAPERRCARRARCAGRARRRARGCRPAASSRRGTRSAWRPRRPRPRCARPRCAGRAGRRPPAGGSSSSCRPRRRRRARWSWRSSWRGSAAGTCPGPAARATARSAGCHGMSRETASSTMACVRRARTAGARPAGSAARSSAWKSKPCSAFTRWFTRRTASAAGRHAHLLLGVAVDHVVAPRLAGARGSCPARCARRTRAGAPARRARRRARATCRPASRSRTRPRRPSEHECSPDAGQRSSAASR